jgi:vWA domain found in the FtsH ternary systems/N-terminal helical region fused to the FtsH ternary system vWA domain
MQPLELRNLADARRFVVQGLWLQGVRAPAAESVRPALEWALATAANGHPLLPVGVIADLGHIAFGADRGPKAAPGVPNWPAALARGYEDHVLGKAYADWAFERAADALRTYPAADRPRGLAFTADHVRDRLGLAGVELAPGVVRGLLGVPADALLADGYESLSRDGVLPLLVSQYEELVAAARRTAELLGPEDVTALEQRTALAELGQYVAHRQILIAAANIASHFPARPVRPLAGRKEVPTRVADEDAYPVGGYSSVSTKGTIESLLHSQLAFMEPDERPDLFDVKYVRDELYYYSRDENEFLRRRRAFAVVFDPGLTAARFKDPALPNQRIVLAQAVVVAVITALSAWLSSDALRFELIFPTADGGKPLAPEAELFAVLFRESITRGEIVLRPTEADAAGRVRDLGRGNETHALWVGPAKQDLDLDRVVLSQLIVAGPAPILIDGRGEAVPLDAESPADAWAEVALALLHRWV